LFEIQLRGNIGEISGLSESRVVHGYSISIDGVREIRARGSRSGNVKSEE
jgi:hypothetical protein